jgi:hypothetical protein
MSYQFARISAQSNLNPTASRTATFSNTRARGYGEHPAVVRQRLIEDQRLLMQNEVAHDFQANQHAEWERKTDKMMNSNQLQRLSRQLKEGDEQILKNKRARLAAKLTEEDARYREEVASLVETPQERAKRMVANARKFKQERESRRALYAQHAMERQWKESCDDLRTIDSKYFNSYCGEQVKRQMDKRKEKLEEIQVEEKQWADMLEENRRAAVKKEEERQQQRVRNTIENRKALQQQMVELSVAQKAAKAQDEREKEIFQQILAMDAKAAKEKAEEDLERKREINRQNAAYNEQLLRERHERFEREREAERQDLMAKMAAYREDTIRQENNIAQQRADIVEFRNYLARRREEERRMEVEMERLIQEDLDRSNARRDVQWEKERLAREKLMKEVYDTRAKQVFERELMKKEEAKEKEFLKSLAAEDARRAAELEAEEDRQAKDAAARRKFELEQQMKTNQNRLDMMQQAKMAEKLAAEEAERVYQERLRQYKQQVTEQSARNYGLKGPSQRPF